MLQILQLPVLTDNYIYLLHDSLGKQTAVVDPAVAEPVIQALAQNGWHLDYILNTHHHNDHTGANLALKRLYSCQIIGAESDKSRIPGIDLGVKENDQIKLGNTSLRVIETPGHTCGHIVFYCAEHSALFSGDTLFSIGCGRLFEGTATQLWQSLQKIAALSDDTEIYCAHEYTLSNARFALSVDPDNPALQKRYHEVMARRQDNLPTVPSSLANELQTNPFLRPDSLAIRQQINAIDQADSDVFALLRQKKDRFQTKN